MSGVIDRGLKYRRSLKGCIKTMYKSLMHKTSSLRPVPLFSYQDFYTWCNNSTEFKAIYNNWVTSNYDKEQACHVRPIDNLKPFVINNLEVIKFSLFKHHLSKHRLMNIWILITQRCTNSNHPNFNYYGGRGITMCDEWRKEFIAFYDWAMKNGYQKNLSIDRYPNQNGNYEPQNCRWATRKQQSNNRRDNKWVTFEGQTHQLQKWAELTGIKYATLTKRLYVYKWPINKLFLPASKSNRI